MEEKYFACLIRRSIVYLTQNSLLARLASGLVFDGKLISKATHRKTFNAQTFFPLKQIKTNRIKTRVLSKKNAFTMSNAALVMPDTHVLFSITGKVNLTSIRDPFFRALQAVDNIAFTQLIDI